MTNVLSFQGRVAIVTGAGGGLGREYALLLAKRGCRVVVNDLGGAANGAGESSRAADSVVDEIRALGGEAIANYDSVEAGEKVVATALEKYGKVDILINNAGILRDSSFHKMTADDWNRVVGVHLSGAFHVTQAAWRVMRELGYGRVVMTTSAAGLYGNFGQANYAAAKLGLVGLAKSLAVEGRARGIRVNAVAPIATSRLTESMFTKEMADGLSAAHVSPLVAYLCHESCESSGDVFEVGGGFIAEVRLERAEGVLLRSREELTPERVRDSWRAIVGYERSSHPSELASAIQPFFDAAVTPGAAPADSTADSRTGRAPDAPGEHAPVIDVERALGYQFPDMKSSYDERDLALYALGVGAAADPRDEAELRYVYEGHHKPFCALPTFAVVPAINAMMQLFKEGRIAPGLNYGFERTLHGEQFVEIRRAIPLNAKLTHKSRIKNIFDKGKNALVVTETRSFDDEGRELFHNETTTVVRGAGGWGGDRGPAAVPGVNSAKPDREADASLTELIGQNQALIYRLSGDFNPLHVDAEFAKNFGFERPILHGLCTFGYAGRHIAKAVCGGDASLINSIRVRFAEPVFPGETLQTEIWKESETKVIFQCRVVERDKIVLSNGIAGLTAR